MGSDVAKPTDAVYCGYVDAYTQCRPIMERWCQKHGYGDASEDIVQEVFLALLKNLDKIEYDAERTLIPLAWGYLRNRTFKHRRTKARKPAFPVEDFPVSADPAVSPEDLAIQRETCSLLATALEGMPEDQATAIRMRAEDVERAAIATYLGVSPRQVMRMLSEGRATLRAVVAA